MRGAGKTVRNRDCVVAIKEMFGIKQHLAASAHRLGHTVADEIEIFRGCYPQSEFRGQIRSLSHQANCRRARSAAPR